MEKRERRKVKVGKGTGKELVRKKVFVWRGGEGGGLLIKQKLHAIGQQQELKQRDEDNQKDK